MARISSQRLASLCASAGHHRCMRATPSRRHCCATGATRRSACIERASLRVLAHKVAAFEEIARLFELFVLGLKLAEVPVTSGNHQNGATRSSVALPTGD